MLPTRDHLRTKHLHRLKVKGWKKFFKGNGQGKKARVAILISDKNRLQKKGHKKRTGGYFITLKGRIHQDINIVNIYAPNIGAPKYIQNILEDFKKDIDSNTIIVGDFKTPLSKMDHMTGHKASLNKFNKIEIISSIFSDHKGLKLQTNPKGKNPNTQNHED